MSLFASDSDPPQQALQRSAASPQRIDRSDAARPPPDNRPERRGRAGDPVADYRPYNGWPRCGHPYDARGANHTMAAGPSRAGRGLWPEFAARLANIRTISRRCHAGFVAGRGGQNSHAPCPRRAAARPPAASLSLSLSLSPSPLAAPGEGARFRGCFFAAV